MNRGTLLRAAFIAVPTALLLGRWLAVSTSGALWAESLGVADGHARITFLKTSLFLAAFVTAAVWSVGNLLLVYRSIGSVNVPRRVGNLEFFEAVPQHYLLFTAWALGLALALAVSLNATSWWETWLLRQSQGVVGMSEPLLGKDGSFYLFELPWRRTLHGFAVLLTGLGVALALVLYLALGAIRWEERRPQVADLARYHLAGLLAIAALVLFWGYQLEPVELVSGIHRVPFDSVLIDVRLPGARVLSALALVVAGVSLVWLWIPRVSLVVSAWGALVAVSLLVHYVLPSATGMLRSREELTVEFLSNAEERFQAVGFGLDWETELISSETLEPTAALLQAEATAAVGLVWDRFAVTETLSRTATHQPFYTFYDSHLTVYRDEEGSVLPVFIGVREVDLQTARDIDRRLDWERVHSFPYAYASGTLAASAVDISEEGEPKFVVDLTDLDSLSDTPVELELDDPAIRFGPHLGEYAVLPSTEPVVGVRAGGVMRRLALGWTLQSHRIIASGEIEEDSRVVWHRSIRERLEEFAPFARFGDAYPIISGRELYWISDGYVRARAFPLSWGTTWRQNRVRYLRSGLIGVVNAHDGTTAVYLRAAPDPLSLAWAELLPGIVRGARALPEGLAPHLRYPEELFSKQLHLLTQFRPQELAVVEVTDSLLPSQVRAGMPYWWVEQDTGSLLARAVVEDGDPPAIVGLLEGGSGGDTLSLRFRRLSDNLRPAGVSELDGRLGSLLVSSVPGVSGPIKFDLLGGRLLAIKTRYRTTGSPNDPPTLAGVGVEWSQRVSRGPNLGTALISLLTAQESVGTLSPEFEEARRLFQRMDAARVSGDWAAFGRAYESLKALLGIVRPDSVGNP